MNTNKEGKENNSNWIENLAAQSWQVELIASGLAILGSFALGDQIDYLVQKLATFFGEKEASVMGYGVMYLYFAQAGLVIGFVLHLCLRILWVGLLGLSSVYPEGINIESKSSYTPEYLQALKEEFPSLTESAAKVENYCSIIFSILCTFVIVTVNMVLWIFLMALVFSLSSRFLPESVFNAFSYFFVLVILLITGAVSLISTGPWKNKPFAKKYAYKLSRGLGKATTPFGYEVINLMTQTIRTNVSGWRFGLGMFAIILISVIFNFSRIDVVKPYYDDDYARYKALPYQTNSESYLDSAERHFLLDPCIQSSTIDGDFLILFLPDFRRDYAYREKICGKYERVDSLSQIEKRRLRTSFSEQCVQQCYQISLNEQQVSNLSFYAKTHQHNDESGYEVIVPIADLPAGRHIVKLETTYEYATKRKFERSIPFIKRN